MAAALVLVTIAALLLTAGTHRLRNLHPEAHTTREETIDAHRAWAHRRGLLLITLLGASLLAVITVLLRARGLITTTATAQLLAAALAIPAGMFYPYAIATAWHRELADARIDR